MGKRHQEFVETNKALFDLESISHLEHSLSKLQLNVICVARGQDETSDFSNFINLQRLEFSKDCGFNPQYDLELPPLLQVLQLNEDFTAGLGRLPLSLEIVICSEDYIDLEYLVLWVPTVITY